MKQHITYSYSFAELSEAAQKKAVETVAEKLSGDWWDESDNDDIHDLIVYTFAQEIGAPDVVNWGQGDFPGIPGIKLESWSCNHMQGDHVGFAGRLTRENAPALPWADGIDCVELENPWRGGTRITVELVYTQCVCDPWAGREPTCEAHDESNEETTDSQQEAMRDAIESAIRKAHQAGYKEVEYKGSSEYAREWIECTEPEFTEEGDLFS